MEDMPGINKIDMTDCEFSGALSEMVHHYWQGSFFKKSNCKLVTSAHMHIYSISIF